MQRSIKTTIETVKLLVPLPSELTGRSTRQIIDQVKGPIENPIFSPICEQFWKDGEFTFVRTMAMDWCWPSLGQLYIRHLHGQKS